MDEAVLGKLEEIRKLTLIGVKNVLTLEEASIYTGLSADRLRHLASPKVGQIACSADGRTLAFLKSDLDAYRMRGRRQSIAEIQSQATTRIARTRLHNQ